MGPIGVQEIVVIFVIALLLFGPKKLPELGRTLGKAITEFRRASNELKSTFEGHLSELEREVKLEDKPTYSSSSTPAATYPYPHDEYGQYTPDYNSPLLPAATTTEGSTMHVSPSAETPHQENTHSDYYSSERPVYSGSSQHHTGTESAAPKHSSSATDANHNV